MAWTSKYSFVAMMVDQNLLADGFNEEGLSCGILWFPDAKYPDVSDKSDDTILGTHKALSTVNVYSYTVPFLKGIPTRPLHHP